MAVVKSVQHHTITISSGNTSAQADLTGTPSTDTSDCIPFFSTRVSSISTTDEDAIDEYSVSVDFVSGTPNKVRARTESVDGNLRAVVVEVTVVEFNSTEVNVYQGTATIAENATSIVLTGGTAPFPSAVVLAKTWLTFGNIAVGDFEEMYYQCPRGRITDTNELTFDVDDTGCTVNIDWYVAECKNSEWAVDRVDITIADTASNGTDTFTAVGSTAKTFVLGSYKVGAGVSGKSIESTCCETVLTNTTTVTCSRHGSDGPIVWSGFVVELAGNENVYRGNISQTTNPATENDNIGATVASGDAMVVRPGNIGSLCAGKWSGFNSADMPDAMVAWTFNGTGDVTQVTATHSTNGTDNDTVLLSWEVVEWDIDAGTSRRVFVVS